MEKIKVSYVKRWDAEGTCYRKGFALDNREALAGLCKECETKGGK